MHIAKCPKCGDKAAKRILLLRTYSWLCPNQDCDYFDWDHAIDLSRTILEQDSADELSLDWDDDRLVLPDNQGYLFTD